MFNSTFNPNNRGNLCVNSSLRCWCCSMFWSSFCCFTLWLLLLMLLKRRLFFYVSCCHCSGFLLLFSFRWRLVSCGYRCCCCAAILVLWQLWSFSSCRGIAALGPSVERLHEPHTAMLPKKPTLTNSELLTVWFAFPWVDTFVVIC